MSKLSEDIIFEILSWLPVSSLLRFRVVCKSWFILITQNSSFAKSQLLHANSTQIDNPTVLFTSDYHDTLCSFKYVDIASSSSPLSLANVNDNENLMKHPATLNCFESAASCNGLICISMLDKPSTICLWNPSTKKIKELPEIPYKHPTEWYDLLAFGFGCTLDDYKVIRILIESPSTLDDWDDNEENLYINDDNEENLYINVYTLGTNSWKRIRDMRFNKFRLQQVRSGLHINGGLHWIGSVSPSESNNGIFSFDIEDEEFRDVPKPQCLGGMDNAGLHVLGGCLCIFNFDSENCLDVWMMKDYGVKESWTKLFTTTQFNFMDHQRLKPLWLFKHGKILMCMETYAKSLALYDANCDTFEYIGSQPFNVGWFDTVTYIESLVSLGWDGVVTLRTDVHWLLPPENTVKINVHGVCRGGQSAAGAVARDHSGRFLGGLSKTCDVGTPLEAEAQAFLLGIQLINKLDLKNVILEGDAKTVVDLINNRTLLDVSRIRMAVHSCHNFLDQRRDVTCSFSPRETNEVALQLATSAITYRVTDFWAGGLPPPFLLNYLFSDLAFTVTTLSQCSI